MIHIQPGLYVVIEQLETPLAPLPRPLSHGFSRDMAYLVLGAFSLAESADAYFILSNDRDEIWFISNRHLRTQQLLPASTAFRLPRLAFANGKNGNHSERSALVPPDKPATRPRHPRGRPNGAARNSRASKK